MTATAPSPGDAIARAVRARAARIQAMYDAACADAAARGCGVAVIARPGHAPDRIAADLRVPPGVIWEAPTEDALRTYARAVRRPGPAESGRLNA